jgi:pimeloyl-ACP methyl ester carboxylesterase
VARSVLLQVRKPRIGYEAGHAGLSIASIYRMQRHQIAICLAACVCAGHAGHTDTSNQQRSSPAESAEIRPFKVHISDDALADLHRRLDQTRWPDRETVSDRSQGVPLAMMQELASYWRSGYDWRRAEAQLNALPQFTTTIDGVEIHFIHVRSKVPNAMPLIITHGWPGSVIEQLKVIGPLTDPVKYGGRPEDAFDVVIPSLPGYGFSGKPQDKGWDPEHVARAWAELMKRLGYSRYVAQGGDYGAVVTTAMARQAPQGLLGVHISLPATVPPEIGQALATGTPPPGLSDKERAAFEQLVAFNKTSSAYSAMMTTRPQTIGYSLADSPVGLAAWMLGHPGFSEWTPDAANSPTRDDVLNDITLYWLTNTGASAARSYWENMGRSPVSAAAQQTDKIKVPVAVTAFPGEIYRAPESWTRRAYKTLIYFHEAPHGGHFAAWQAPQVFAEEMRAAFRSLRSPAASPR